VKKKLTPERIAELDKFQTLKLYELLYLAMAAGLIPVDHNLRLSRRVRVLKTDPNSPN
jgi:hypothetical protein